MRVWLMSTNSELDVLIGDGFDGIEKIRPVLPALAAEFPTVGGPSSVIVPLIYEALVGLRALIDSNAPDEVRASMAKKAEQALQNLAALRFGAVGE